MILKVLVENNTYIDQYYLGEPAVSFYIEDEEQKILFDTGYSNILLTNAEKMGIDLQMIDTIVFSHGHNDHTAGFQYMVKKYDTTKFEVVSHPACFIQKFDEEEEIGAPYNMNTINKLCKTRLTSKPMKISKNITFLGEIPSSNDFEKRQVIGSYQHDNKRVCDYVLDDSAIVYEDNDGLFIITGCSHSGICNIIEYSKKVCNQEKITGVIGGFHLFKNDDRLEKTIEYFQKNKIPSLYPCHCVSFQVKARMNEVLNVNEVGVGLRLIFDS